MSAIRGVRQIKRFIPARHNSGVAERAEGRGIAKRYVIEARVTSLPPIGPRGFLASDARAGHHFYVGSPNE